MVSPDLGRGIPRNGEGVSPDMGHRIDKRIKKEKRKKESGKRHCVADAWVRDIGDSLVCWGQNPDKSGVMMWRIP